LAQEIFGLRKVVSYLSGYYFRKGILGQGPRSGGVPEKRANFLVKMKKKRGSHYYLVARRKRTRKMEGDVEQGNENRMFHLQ